MRIGGRERIEKSMYSFIYLLFSLQATLNFERPDLALMSTPCHPIPLNPHPSFFSGNNPIFSSLLFMIILPSLCSAFLVTDFCLSQCGECLEWEN